jgi:hypothetical protein
MMQGGQRDAGKFTGPAEARFSGWTVNVALAWTELAEM